MNPPVKMHPKCRGNHNEKDCPKVLFKEETKRLVPPQSVKQSLPTDKSEAKVEEKWQLKKDSVTKKNTEKWVEEQNEFFKREKEKQQEGVPVKFDREKGIPPPQYLIKYLGDQEIAGMVKDNLAIG